MRVIIAGSRAIKSHIPVAQAILESGFEITTAISGCAKGVDTLGEEYAKDNGIPLERYPAKWSIHGNSAGIKRNKAMAEIADALIAVWDGKSRGTKNMIETAKRKGLKVHIKKVECKCGLTGENCEQHTGNQCRGESTDCYWKQTKEHGGKTKC